MNLYNLPEVNFNFLKNKNKYFKLTGLVILVSVIFGFLAGALSGAIFYFQIRSYLEKVNVNLPLPFEKETVKETIKEYIPQTSEEQKVIEAVKEVSPAVVSIIITKDLPVIEKYYSGIEKEQIGGGSGFIVSKDGLVLTNKHVVLDKNADYTVLTNDGKKFKAEVLARDPLQDLAILEIKQDSAPKLFSIVKLGDSEKLESGQTVIAIGNALGEFRNTVSVGVISGLGRKITASGGGFVETLEDVIQTDAAINKGNSGGPLLNLKGEVIGINTAMALGAQSIGFAIPINKAKKAIEQVKDLGKIVYPFLGIRYVLVTEEIKKEYNLSVDYGALIMSGNSGEPAIWPGSVAEKVGLRPKDIVLEFNQEKITLDNSLARIITKYNPGDKVVLKVLRQNKEFEVEVTLDERSE